MKITRELEQEWEYDLTPKEKQGGYYLYTGKVLTELSNYCESFNRMLELLKEYDEKNFNKVSPTPLDTYTKLFNDLYNQLINFTMKPEMYNKDNQKTLSHDKFFALQYIGSFKKGILEVIEEDYFHGNKIPRVMRFKDEVYPTIKKIVDNIFKLEEMIAVSAKKLWENQVIDDIHNFNDLKKYSLFVKVLADWRKEEEDLSSKEICDYMDNRYATSVSYITDKKSRFFMENEYFSSLCGLVYNSNGFMCAHFFDAFLEENINNECPLRGKRKYSKVSRIANYKNHDIFSESIKFCTPNIAINNCYQYNEIILDKRKSKPIAVFYVDKTNENKEKTNTAFNEAQKMAIKFHLPLIRLESTNEKTDSQVY